MSGHYRKLGSTCASLSNMIFWMLLGEHNEESTDRFQGLINEMRPCHESER